MHSGPGSIAMTLKRCLPLRKNILANYLGTAGNILSLLLALPWYLEALGPKQYGLIAFITMLQAVLGLLDAGLGQALVREFTVRLAATERTSRAAALLFGFERIYWTFALTIGSGICLFAGIIAAHWLHLEDLPADLGMQAVYGAGILFAVQFPGALYRSFLVAAEAQVALNGIMLAGVLLRQVGGVIVVLAWPSLLTYLLWHVAIALAETLVRGRWAWKTLGMPRKSLAWDGSELRQVGRFAVAMSGAVWLGALTVQIDKIILSKMVSIEQFGYYAIASTVTMGTLQLFYPIAQAIMPRLIQLRDNPVALRKLCLQFFWMTSMVAGAGILLFLTSAQSLLHLWLRKSDTVAAVHPILALLLIGALINAFYNIGYLRWIALGKMKWIALVNALSLLLALMLIPGFVHWQGTMGAAIGWLTINLIGFLASLGWLKVGTR